MQKVKFGFKLGFSWRLPPKFILKPKIRTNFCFKPKWIWTIQF